MEITSEIKKALKKTYKSIKKNINKFFKKLGFNKIETIKISNKISNDVNNLIETCLNSRYFEQIDLLYQVPSFWTKSDPNKPDNVLGKDDVISSEKTPIYENIKHINEKQGNKYKELLNDANNILLNEKQVPLNKREDQAVIIDEIEIEK